MDRRSFMGALAGTAVLGKKAAADVIGAVETQYGLGPGGSLAAPAKQPTPAIYDYKRHPLHAIWETGQRRQQSRYEMMRDGILPEHATLRSFSQRAKHAATRRVLDQEQSVLERLGKEIFGGDFL